MNIVKQRMRRRKTRKEEKIERRNCVEIEKIEEIILKELNARTQQLVNIHFNTIHFSYHYA